MLVKKFGNYASKYALIALGAAFYAAGFRLFSYPNSIAVGGITGVAMIINYLTKLPVGVLTIAMNIPLFVIAWKKFGLEFMVSSLVGMALSSIFVDVFDYIGYTATHDIILAAVFGGVLKGTGLGLVYTMSATTGGTDIIAKLLRRKYQHLNFGTLVLAVDVTVVAAFGLIFKYYAATLYSFISMYISSRVIDIVLFGAVDTKVCYVITDASAKITEAVTNEMRRGVTLLHGEGGWSGKNKNIILCVIKPRQIVKLKEIVKEADPAAFVIVCDSHEVFGKNFSYIGSDD